MSKLIRNSTAEFLIFTNQTGDQSIEVRYEGNEIWLTQKRMADLFEVNVRTVNEHLKIFLRVKNLTNFQLFGISE